MAKPKDEDEVVEVRGRLLRLRIEWTPEGLRMHQLNAEIGEVTFTWRPEWFEYDVGTGECSFGAGREFLLTHPGQVDDDG